MASVYSRERKTGTFWYVDFKGRTYPAGKGKIGKQDAHEIAVELDRRARRAQAGIIEPAVCLWTIGDLFARVEAESKARDPESTRRYRKGRIERIKEVFPAETRLSSITRGAIDEATRRLAENPLRPKRATAGGRVAANRVMIELRRALRLAREDWNADSHYEGNPFRGWKRFDEKATRRAPIVIDAKLRNRMLEAAREIVAAAGTPEKRFKLEQDLAMLELFFLTASRLSQVMRMEKAWVKGDVLVFPPQKRGRARSFDYAGDIRAIIEPRMKGPSRFVFPQRQHSRSHDRPRDNMAGFWELLRKKKGIPKGISAHHIKHSQITAGSASGMSDQELMLYGGWTSTQMIEAYRHPGAVRLKEFPIERVPVLPSNPNKIGRKSLTGPKGRLARKARKSLK